MSNRRVKIRKAASADAKGIARVHVDSWKTTYADIIPDEYLQNLAYEKQEQLWINNIPQGGVYVAENDDGEIVGFSSGGAERSGKYSGYDGELYAIYILKEHQGQGIGRALFKPVIDELKRMRIGSMLVLVLEENASRQFYEALGGQKIDAVEVEIGGRKLSELVYGWEDIRKIQGSLLQ
ncbi:GNAT family N-acetyltransferase [Bacillus glycinifermentans]|uniref:GNAT family N-acetyltransferase n=1 Tax=Bacillus glycinifermentans TaxID=1664069 RepID=UPI001FF6BAF2|nr:GNAT family N-acetyltransferase [Bacillus glycinifermentans]UOY89874.1 GNAT family N-acetyltransferase [Bacillus glycinifermentans]